MKKIWAHVESHLISHKVYRSNIAACLMTFIIFFYSFSYFSLFLYFFINKNLTLIRERRRYKRKLNKPPTNNSSLTPDEDNHEREDSGSCSFNSIFCVEGRARNVKSITKALFIENLLPIKVIIKANSLEYFVEGLRSAIDF